MAFVGNQRLDKRILLIIFALLLLTACSVRDRGVYHTVRKDETLWRIAQAYNCEVDTIAKANGIDDARRIEAGSLLFIPGADRVRVTTDIPAPVKKIPPTPRKQVAPKPAPTPKPTPRPEPVVKKKPDPPPAPRKTPVTSRAKTRFVWPAKGTILSKFGKQSSGMRNTGIKISLSEGTPVRAAANGRVIHSAPIKYFGETIIIKHDRHYTTVYAHLDSRSLKVGDTVTRGAVIARSGREERTGRESLHFEVRYDNVAKNPLTYLPK